MNLIGTREVHGIAVELKYCERCGGLWLRPQGETEVYCKPCRARMAEIDRPAEGRPGRPRLPRPKAEDIQQQVQIEYLQAVAQTEVRA